MPRDSPETSSTRVCQFLPWRMHNNWNTWTCIFPTMFSQETDLGKIRNIYALLPQFDYSSGVFEVWRLSSTWAFSSGFLTSSSCLLWVLLRSLLQAAPLVPARSPLKPCFGVFLLLSFTAFVFSAGQQKWLLWLIPHPQSLIFLFVDLEVAGFSRDWRCSLSFIYTEDIALL